MKKMTKIGYDIIGDVHGCAKELKELLHRLGYQCDDAGVYRHSERTVVFIGDLVDRGEGQLEVLEIAKAMVDAGTAQMVMGNHEFNAVCYKIKGSDGKYIREHSDHNEDEHKKFLALTDEQQQYYLDWFRTLPLWLEIEAPNGNKLRLIHACWHPESMKVVEEVCGADKLTTDEHYMEARRKGSRLYWAVETLLKGPEISLTKHGHAPYRDFIGKIRTDARARWWDRDAATLRDIADVRGVRQEHSDEPYPPLPPDPVEHFDFSLIYTDPVPVIYGHYWFQWDNHREDWTEHTACVDFSAVKGGKLVAYRWNGEPTITWENYEPHDPDIVAPTPSD